MAVLHFVRSVVSEDRECALCVTGRIHRVEQLYEDLQSCTGLPLTDIHNVCLSSFSNFVMLSNMDN